MGLINYFEEKRLERERAIRNEQVIDSLKILASIGAGFTLGVLFAKKSGKETRKNISNATKEGLNYVGKNLNNAKNYIKDKTSDMKEAIAEKYDEIKTKTIPEKIDDFEDKVEDVKEEIKK
ncbi:MAG: YtxH domain-containing protein [Leptotrichia wadei]|nr:YtxH domain-containing protein [Leptotrichia wadei]